MFSKMTLRSSLLSVFLFTFCVFTLLLPSTSFSQEGKPSLSVIQFNDKNNNEDVLKILEKLDPDLFYTEPTYEQIKKTKHFGRYIPLDDKNKNNFIALNIADGGYFCTSYGCPTYIYKKLNNNKWTLVLSVQSNGLYMDVNTKGSKPKNIISISTESGKQKPTIWLWNGLRYIEAKAK